MNPESDDKDASTSRDTTPRDTEKDTILAEPIGDNRRRVAYFFDEDIGSYAFNFYHFMKPHRARMVHEIVTSYGLDRFMDVLRPDRSSAHELTRFHTDEYVDFLRKVTPENYEELSCNATRFLPVIDDNPPWVGLYEHATISAGGSVSAARRINEGLADIGVNWAGGLHHAKKREGSGFCFVNDIVLAILELLRCHKRVLYIDIDVHHGDGVEEAFYTTDRVMTCSFHHYGDFFPGTGSIQDAGIGRGKNYAVNVPLKAGIDRDAYQSVFRPVILAIMEWYRPGAVVLQCGADSLAEDRLGPLNLTMEGHADCAEFLRSFNVPLILVGGGGYTIRNVARAWSYETGIACGIKLPRDMPYNSYIHYFGPTYKLDVPANNMSNANSREYLDGIVSQVLTNLKSMPFAPSVEQQVVPPDFDTDSSHTHLQGDTDDFLDDDSLDARAARYIMSLRRSHKSNAVPPSPPPMGIEPDIDADPGLAYANDRGLSLARPFTDDGFSRYAYGSSFRTNEAPVNYDRVYDVTWPARQWSRAPADRARDVARLHRLDRVHAPLPDEYYRPIRVFRPSD